MTKMHQLSASTGQRRQGVPELAKGYIPGTNAVWTPDRPEQKPVKLPKGGSSVVPPPQANSEKVK